MGQEVLGQEVGNRRDLIVETKLPIRLTTARACLNCKPLISRATKKAQIAIRSQCTRSSLSTECSTPIISPTRSRASLMVHLRKFDFVKFCFFHVCCISQNVRPNRKGLRYKRYRYGSDTVKITNLCEIVYTGLQKFRRSVISKLPNLSLRRTSGVKVCGKIEFINRRRIRVSDRSSMSFSGGDFLPPEPSLSMYICIACSIRTQLRNRLYLFVFCINYDGLRDINHLVYCM